MRTIFRVIALICALLGLAPVAFAQQTNYIGTVFIADSTNPSRQLKVNSDGSINVDGTFSGTLAGFTPNLNFATLTAAGTSGSVALPVGLVVKFQNTGTTAISCTAGTGSATATTNEIIVQPGGATYLAVGSYTWGACIDQTGSTSNTVVLAGGTGLGTDTGGGGSSGGGGGAVYGPTAAGTAAANPPVEIGGTIDGGATSNVSIWKINSSGLGFVSAVVPSGGIASGAIASGALASGSIAAGAVSAGAFVSGSVLSGAYASGAFAAGSMVDLLTMRGTVGAGTAPADALIGGLVYNSGGVTPSNGQSVALQGDANGYLEVNIKAGAGSGGTALADGATFTLGTTSETPVACTYNSSYTTITSGKSAVLSCTNAGSLHTTVDNTNANVTPANATATTAASPVWSENALYNGTTWDNAPGDHTLGAYTDIKGVNGTAFSITNPFFDELTDGTNGPVAVKPASTPSPAADKSLSVTLNAGSNGIIPSATHISCSALCANLVVDAAPATVFSFEVAADSTLSGAAWWIMVYDATSAPADGSVTPAKCYAAPSGATNFNGAFTAAGVAFTTGITIGVSTTGCYTKTASTHAFISGDYH